MREVESACDLSRLNAAKRRSPSMADLRSAWASLSDAAPHGRPRDLSGGPYARPSAFGLALRSTRNKWSSRFWSATMTRRRARSAGGLRYLNVGVDEHLSEAAKFDAVRPTAGSRADNLRLSFGWRSIESASRAPAGTPSSLAGARRGYPRRSMGRFEVNFNL